VGDNVVASINWEEIRKEWEATDITLKDLAEKHGIKLGTLKSRKSREKWSRDAPRKDATKIKKVATSKKRDATKKQVKKNAEQVLLENDELTDKQKLFCLYYVKYFNATKAYQKAYGCDYHSAMANGSRLMRNDKIAAEIERLKAEQAAAINLDAQAVLQKYVDIAFADITDYVEFGREKAMDPETGVEYEVNRVKLKDSAEVDGTIVTEVKQGRDGVSVKLADKMKALEFLAKYVDLLSESDRRRLQDEKIKAETEFTKERTKQLRGIEKDTSMLEVLIQGRKQYEQMLKEREENDGDS